MLSQVSKTTYAAFVLAAVFGLLVPMLLGCETSMALEIQNNPTQAGVRLTGGSVPDGELVNGQVIDWGTSSGTGTRSLLASQTCLPASGATVKLTPVLADGSTAAPSSVTTDADGRFTFTATTQGTNRVDLSYADRANSTVVNLDPSGAKRMEVLVGVVREDQMTKDAQSIKVASSALQVRPGGLVDLTATVAPRSRECPDIAWVMETATDAALVPTAQPNTARLQAGPRKGSAVITAQIGCSKSNSVTVQIN